MDRGGPVETIVVSTTLLFLIDILCPTSLIFLLKSRVPKFFLNSTYRRDIIKFRWLQTTSRKLQSSFNAVFCHSGHTSNFLICVGYHQNNISISKENYPRHILVSKNLFGHRYHVLQPNTQLKSPIIFHPCWPQGPHFTLQHLFNSTPVNPVYLWQNVSTCLAILMAVAVRRYYTVHITWWRRSMAFIKATKCHHWASTHSDTINWTHLPLIFGVYFIVKSLKKSSSCPNNNRGVTHPDEKHLNNMSKYFVGVVNSI